MPPVPTSEGTARGPLPFGGGPLPYPRPPPPNIEHMNDMIRDAVEAPPWRPGQPQPRITVYPPGRQPALEVRIDGRWRYAPVHARHDRHDGIAYQVDVQLTAADGATGGYVRTYRWGTGGIRAAK